MPPLQRQLSARRRSLTKPEDKIFTEADADSDGHLNLDEFRNAMSILKDSEKRPADAADEEQMGLFHEFLTACVADEALLKEVWDELRISKQTTNDLGVSRVQWTSAEFFEDDD